ncbi:uncharacterized protein TNCV_4657211 [Trichonephila clavipes]|nr:uncharacterized protein TNCV_4657211 [Trichonephila clavipes]
MPDIKIVDNILCEEIGRLNVYLNFNKLKQLENQHAEIDKRWETAICNLKCQNCGLLDKRACKCTCADGWDSPDCSRICKDDHQRCGMNPGFPTKASCSLNNFSIAKKYCRKMCRSCNPLIEHTIFNHVCCERKLCGDGYVLDLKNKPCSCTLLCPGPKCDNERYTLMDKKISVPRRSRQNETKFYTCNDYFDISK